MDSSEDKKENLISIGKRLKMLRMNADVTQADAAKDLGMSQQSLSGLEKGLTKMDVNTLSKVSEYYGVSSDYILGLDQSTMRATEAQAASEMRFIQMLARNKKD